MASTELMMHSIAQSNLPSGEKKSLIRQMLERGGAITKSARHHVKEGMHTVGSAAIGGIGGALLGIAHAEVGLDVKGKVPVDGLLAVIGLGGSVLMADDPVSSYVGRNVGVLGLTTFTFRQGYAFAAEKKAAKGGVPTGFKMLGHAAAHGDFGEDIGADPILAMAKEF